MVKEYLFPPFNIGSAREERKAIATPVQIHFSIEGMKHSIVQALTDYEGEIREGIKQAAVKYLENLNWEEIVADEVKSILYTHIRTTIRREVEDALSQRIDDVVKEQQIASLAIKRLMTTSKTEMKCRI